MRARLHLRGHRLGFFRENSHDVCDARATRQLLPATADALERLMAAMRSLGLADVREVELSENIDASERVVFLDASAAIDASTLERLAGTDGLTGLGSAFGAYGSPYVTDSLTIGDRSLRLRRHVQSFFQGNRHLLGDLVAHVAARVPAGGAVLDLYAGVGLFSVAAALLRGARVLAVEGDAYAADDLRANGAAAGGQVTTIRGAVEGIGAELSSWRRASGVPAIESVIVDPPRTGLSRAAMESVLALVAPRLIYVSCARHPGARQPPHRRRRLCDRAIDGFDLFPNTPHVNAVVVFTRVDGGTAKRCPTYATSSSGMGFCAASMKPSKSGRNSPVRKKFSGCHWTPRQKRAAGSSIASAPSGAVADTLTMATSFTA